MPGDCLSTRRPPAYTIRRASLPGSMRFTSWLLRKSMRRRCVCRPMQSPTVASNEHDAHAAALGDVDDLLLGGPTENCHAVLRRGKAHDNVERLGVNAAVGANHRKLAHGNA